MLFDMLRVLHAPKQIHDGKHELAPLSTWADQGFYFESCLRTLLIYANREDVNVTDAKDLIHHYEGADAYDFLLRVATGLESPLKGETEIFGQLKQAWADYLGQANGHGQTLIPLFDKLFNDVKSIRSDHLQGIGGSSYGSLVRKVLATAPNERILIIGAGDLAAQMAPLLINWSLSIWNRDKAKLTKLVASLKKPKTSTIVGIGDEALLEAVATHEHIVICIPVDKTREMPWVELRRAKSAGRVVHLGGLDETTRHWQDIEGFYGLTAILQLDRQQDEIRQLKLQKALLACQEKASQRELAETLNLLNGWEDLSFSR